jgi:hypothetical protein
MVCVSSLDTPSPASQPLRWLPGSEGIWHVPVIEMSMLQEDTDDPFTNRIVNYPNQGKCLS